jgi:hypothetical protein
MLIVESQRLVAQWEWAERRLFEIVGGWAASAPEPQAARWFATTSHHHAWRASLWQERTPRLHDVPATERPSWSALLDAVAAPADTALRFAGLEVATAALLEEYEAALAETTEVADGPLRRGLRLAIPDAAEDRQSAAAMLAVAPDDEHVADHRSSVSALRRGPVS